MLLLRDRTNGGGWAAGKVWIDWNADGDWDDANEEIGEMSAAVGGQEVVYPFSVTVPAGTALGNKRMRIRTNDNSTAIDPHGADGRSGTAQDYLIAVVDVVPDIEITGYDAISDVLVRANDTAVDTVAEVQGLLPSTVTISGTSDTRSVTWTTDSTPAYDNSSAGTYVFTATLGAIPSGYKDDTAETVTANVVVTDSFGVEVLTAADSIVSTANLTGTAFSMSG